MLTADSELLDTRYKDKLESRYEEPIHQVITKIFRGLSGKKVIMPSKDFVRLVPHADKNDVERTNNFEATMATAESNALSRPMKVSYISWIRV